MVRSSRACLRWFKYMGALFLITFIITAGFMSRKSDVWIMNSLAFDNVIAIEERNSVSVSVFQRADEDLYPVNNSETGYNSSLNTSANSRTTSAAYSFSKTAKVVNTTWKDTNETDSKIDDIFAKLEVDSISYNKSMVEDRFLRNITDLKRNESSISYEDKLMELLKKKDKDVETYLEFPDKIHNENEKDDKNETMNYWN